MATSPHHPHTSVGHPPIWARFHRAFRLYGQLMSRRAAERGAHPGQMYCLTELAHHDGITQRDLADLLHVARPSVTAMLQKMERAGLIERRIDAEDQRFTRIFVTGTGAAQHAAMHELAQDVYAEVFGSLSDHDAAEFERLLGLIGDSMAAALVESPGTCARTPADDEVTA